MHKRALTELNYQYPTKRPALPREPTSQRLSFRGAALLGRSSFSFSFFFPLFGSQRYRPKTQQSDPIPLRFHPQEAPASSATSLCGSTRRRKSRSRRNVPVQTRREKKNTGERRLLSAAVAAAIFLLALAFLLCPGSPRPPSWNWASLRDIERFRRLFKDQVNCVTFSRALCRIVSKP